MSSDNQWTALGPAEIGFQTHGANIRVGADIAGNQLGVKGRCQGPVGDGVQGVGTGNFSGVAGFGDGRVGTGVFGAGRHGVRGIGNGGPNTAPAGPVGVYGQAGPGADGVHGVGSGTTGAGVRGLSFDVDGNGVIGQANVGGNAFGIWGRSVDGFAGMFDGRVRVRGDFDVTGAKAALVTLPDGSELRMYAVESPQSWFEDFGFGRLVDGRAEVRLDADFAALVTDDAYHVFVTSYEDNNGLFVTGRTMTGFEVRAAVATASGEFSYRVVAMRKDVTAQRFARLPASEKTGYDAEPPVEVPTSQAPSDG
jgi:hypothetical protein